MQKEICYTQMRHLGPQNEGEFKGEVSRITAAHIREGSLKNERMKGMEARRLKIDSVVAVIERYTYLVVRAAVWRTRRAPCPLDSFGFRARCHRDRGLEVATGCN